MCSLGCLAELPPVRRGWPRGWKGLPYLEDAILRGWNGIFRILEELVMLLGWREDKRGQVKRDRVAHSGGRSRCEETGKRIGNKACWKVPVASEFFTDPRVALLAADTKMAEHQARHMVENVVAGPASPEA